MTDLPEIVALFEKVRKACPCVNGQICRWQTEDPLPRQCLCNTLTVSAFTAKHGKAKCRWPGHTALDEIASRQHSRRCDCKRTECKGEK